MLSIFRILPFLILPFTFCFAADVIIQESENTLKFTVPGGALNDIDTQGVLAEITATAALLGSKNISIDDVWTLLDLSNLDLDTSKLVDVRAFDTEVTLPVKNCADRQLLTHYLNESANSPLLERKQIEVAKRLLKDNCETLRGHFDDTVIDEKIRLLETITATQAQEHFDEVWPQNLEIKPEVNQESEASATSTVLIDGKIYMNEPRWYKTRWYGRIFGAFLAVVTVGLFIVAFIIQPFVSAIGVFTLFTSVYFTALPYYEDPQVVKEKRIEDLERGFLHSYKCGRAEKTLTPCERRVLYISGFLKYSEVYPSKLSNFPIANLADTFNLSKPVMKSFLYASEIKELQNLKDEFIANRNQFKHERNQLEDELISLLKPHQILRDIGLDNSRRKYEADSFVVGLRRLQGDLGEQIDAVWESWRQGKISSEERDRRIDETESYYKDLMQDEFLIDQVTRAREFLELEQERILRNFKDAERNCKNLIKFEQRLQNIENGMWGLYSRYSDYLVSYISTITEYDYDTFPDYLDLR